MKTLKKLWNLLPAMLLWLMISVFLWGFVFARLTDTQPENKLTLFVDAKVPQATRLAVQLEDNLLDETIQMVKVHPFTYAMVNGQGLRQADVYIVRASHVEEYRDWFAPLPEALAADQPEENLLLLDGTPCGLRLYDAATQTGSNLWAIQYQDPALPDEDYYLFIGAASVHLEDGKAVQLAQSLLK